MEGVVVKTEAVDLSSNKNSDCENDRTGEEKIEQRFESPISSDTESVETKKQMPYVYPALPFNLSPYLIQQQTNALHLATAALQSHLNFAAKKEEKARLPFSVENILDPKKFTGDRRCNLKSPEFEEDLKNEDSDCDNQSGKLRFPTSHLLLIKMHNNFWAISQ